ncbi:hypothetical protein VPH35_074020 [Triticum aestivum]
MAPAAVVLHAEQELRRLDSWSGCHRPLLRRRAIVFWHSSMRSSAPRLLFSVFARPQRSASFHAPCPPRLLCSARTKPLHLPVGQLRRPSIAARSPHVRKPYCRCMLPVRSIPFEHCQPKPFCDVLSWIPSRPPRVRLRRARLHSFVKYPFGCA